HFATVFVLVDHAAVVVYALSLHDALPIFVPLLPRHGGQPSFNGARPQWRPGVGSLRAGCPTQKPAARHRCHGSLLPEPPAMARGTLATGAGSRRSAQLSVPQAGTQRAAGIFRLHGPRGISQPADFPDRRRHTGGSRVQLALLGPRNPAGVSAGLLY